MPMEEGTDVQVHPKHRLKMDRWFYLSFPRRPLPASWTSWEMDPSDWHEPVRIRWFWLPLSRLPDRSWTRVLQRHLRRHGQDRLEVRVTTQLSRHRPGGPWDADDGHPDALLGSILEPSWEKDCQKTPR